MVYFYYTIITKYYPDVMEHTGFTGFLEKGTEWWVHIVV